MSLDGKSRRKLPKPNEVRSKRIRRHSCCNQAITLIILIGNGSPDYLRYGDFKTVRITAPLSGNASHIGTPLLTLRPPPPSVGAGSRISAVQPEPVTSATR